MGIDPFAALGIDAPAAGSPASGAPQSDALPSFPMVAPHPFMGSGPMINMSDEDYGKFTQGQSPPAQSKPAATKGGIDPFKALGIDTTQTYEPSAPPANKPPYGGFENSWRTASGQGLRQAAVGLVSSLVDPVASLAAAPPALNPDGTRPASTPIGDFLRGVGVPDVQPTTRAAQMEQAAAAGAGGMVFGGPLLGGSRTVPGMIGNAVQGALGGIAGNVAENAAPEPLKPLAGLAANTLTQTGAGVAGGLTANAVTNRFVKQPTSSGIAAPPNVQRKALGQVSDALGSEGWAKIQAATDAEVRARALEQQLATPGISDADRVAAQRELNGLQDQRLNAVPGSDPTLSQVAPGPNVKALENQSKQLYNPQFTARQDAQNNAQLALIRGTGGPGDASSVGRFFTDELDRITSDHGEYLDALERQGADRLNEADAAGQQRIGATQSAGDERLDQIRTQGSEALDALARQHQDQIAATEAEGQANLEKLGTGLKETADQARVRLEQEARQAAAQARQGVQTQSENVGGMASPDATGEAIRTALAQPEEAATARVSRMYQAIDPDNKLVVDKTPAIQAAQAIRKEFGPEQWEKLPSDLAPVKYWVEKIGGSNDPAQRFNDFGRDLQFLGAELRSLQAKGLDPRSTTAHYLGILKTAMQKSIEGAIDRAATQDSGIAERMNEYGRSESGSGSSLGGGPVAGTDGVAGAGRATGDTAQRPGDITRPGDMAIGATARGANPESLIDWVISKGGVRDDRGDLRANDLHLIHNQGGGRLLNPNGSYADDLAQRAHSEGFPTPDLNAFKDKLAEDAAGRIGGGPRVVQSSDAAEAWARTQNARDASREAHDRFMAGANVKELADSLGVRLRPAEEAHATELHLHGATPVEAVHDAVRAGEEEEFQRNADRNVVGNPGVPIAARQGEMPVAQPQLTPNLTVEKANEIRVARLAHAQKKETFWQGPVGATLKGAVLRDGNTIGTYSVENAKVAKQFLTGDPAEPGRVQKFIAAVGGAPEAVDAMREALVSDLRARKIIDEDGMLDANKLKDWLRPDKRGRTVDLFPGLREQLGDVEAAQRTYDETVAAHQQRAADFNRQAAADYMAQTGLMKDENKTSLGVVKSETAAEMAQAKREHADALRGIQSGNASDLGAARAEHANNLRGIRTDNAQELRTAKSERAAELRAFNQGPGKFAGGADPVEAMGRIFNSTTRGVDVESVLARARKNPEVLDGLRRLTADYIERKFATGRPTDPEGDFNAKMFNAKAYREFLDKNGDVLKPIFGGQGYQNLYGVGADMRRQLAATEAQASPGPDTARKLAGLAKHGAGPMGHGMGATAFALIGEHVLENLSKAVGHIPGAGIIGIAGGALIHTLRQAGITSRNDLIREMMLNPKFALEMRANVTGGKLTPVVAARIAGALRGAINQAENR